MPKAQEVPKELREFNELFESFAFKHNPGDVFRDFLLMFLKGVTLEETGHDWDKQNIIWQEKYEQKERHTFGKMIFHYLEVAKHQINIQGWWDGFGTYYEIIAGKYKKAGLGQFFTPKGIVDLLTHFTEMDGEKGKLNDPACGSARMALAANVASPGIYCVMEDIDETCCHMSCLNMFIHGVVGEVIHHNSLMPESFYSGWKINEQLSLSGMPFVRKIKQEEFSSPYLVKEKTESKTIKPDPIEQTELRTNEKAVQLCLF